MSHLRRVLAMIVLAFVTSFVGLGTAAAVSATGSAPIVMQNNGIYCC